MIGSPERVKKKHHDSGVIKVTPGSNPEADDTQ
jgi:hypothetical protein